MRFAVVGDITVEVQRDDWEHYVVATLTLSPDKRRYVTRRLEVGVSDVVTSLDKLPSEYELEEVTGVLLRTIRVAEIARLGALGGIFVSLSRDEPPVSLLQWMGPEPKYGSEIAEVMRDMGPVRSNLELLSLYYHAAQIAGEPPAKAVENVFGLPARTAAYWIAKAKGEGLLDPLTFRPFSPPDLWVRSYHEPYGYEWPGGLADG